jgi:hypothetical protein
LFRCRRSVAGPEADFILDALALIPSGFCNVVGYKDEIKKEFLDEIFFILNSPKSNYHGIIDNTGKPNISHRSLRAQLRKMPAVCHPTAAESKRIFPHVSSQ